MWYVHCFVLGKYSGAYVFESVEEAMKDKWYRERQFAAIGFPSPVHPLLKWWREHPQYGVWDVIPDPARSLNAQVAIDAWNAALDAMAERIRTHGINLGNLSDLKYTPKDTK